MKHQKSRKCITSAFKNWSKSAEALKNQGLPLFLFIICLYDMSIVCLTGSSFILCFLPDISCILLQAYPGRYIIYKPQRPATEAYLFLR